MTPKNENEEIGKITRLLGKLAMVRIEQWRREGTPGDQWRVGIEWYGDDDYLFICEQPTLLQALEMVLDHKEEWLYRIPKQ